MYTHGGGLRTHSILAAVILTIACASHGASGHERAPLRGELPLSEMARYATMQDLLAARVPALDVRPLGGGRFTLRVRGRAALANAEPLVVIDGARYPKNGADMLGSLGPRDVRRIEVLQDAASTAGFVGAGPSGVIVVTTWRY